MPRRTILYVGGFELPDLNAAAQRVLANALILRDLGYRVGLVGVTRRQGAPALGLAEELKDDAVSVNSLWPCTLIDTAAIRNMPGGRQMVKAARGPEIMADAAHAILTGANLAAGGSKSGNFYTDEEVLRAAGVSDFAPYSLGAPEDRLVPDIFL